MDRLPVSRGEAAFIVGVPLAWAVLLLFHPSGEADEVYVSLQDEVTEGFVVHIGMLIFIPLMAGVIYSAWEVLQGIANSILVDEVKDLPEAEQPTGIELVQDFAESPSLAILGCSRRSEPWGS